MTPGARAQAAIEVLDRILDGEAPERVLSNWARASRFAGSKDRAAVRDLVYDGLRRRRSAAVVGGAGTGRGIVLGLIRQSGGDPEALFTGEGHAPATLSAAERAVEAPDMSDAVRLDIPDWSEAPLRQSLGAGFEAALEAMRQRAELFLRVNRRRATLESAIAVLSGDSIAAEPSPLADMALRVTGNPRAVARSRAYEDGLVEIQDAASQAVVAALPLPGRGRILDYCAGGGGKALAMAARTDAEIDAHDAAPRRMADLPARAARAGVRIATVTRDQAIARAPYDLVLCDAPCSGSGTWRRNPDAKWTLDAASLDALVRLQAEILREAAALVAPGGVLAYATCSILDAENADQVEAFLRDQAAFAAGTQMSWSPADGADGMYLAVLHRAK
jgi:16S rRNA (cytosine967-C5)-methyltransferase